jgi:hypothetical protein
VIVQKFTKRKSPPKPVMQTQHNLHSFTATKALGKNTAKQNKPSLQH